MITFIAHLRVPPENEAEFEALMAHVTAMTQRHEPDVLHYSFAKCADEPNAWVVVEVYRDAAANVAHLATPWVRESLPRSAQLIDGPPAIRQYVSPGTEPIRRNPVM